MNTNYTEIERPKDMALHDAVMGRIRVIHMLRVILNPEIVKSVIFIVSVSSVTLMIHLGQVISNMSTLPGVASYPAYLLGAFLHTELVVQSIVVLAGAAGVWLTVDMTRRIVFRKCFWGERGFAA